MKKRLTCKNMCLSIDISQSEQKEFNIDNSSQRSSEGFNFSIETFGRGIGTSIDKEIKNFFVMFINCSSYCIKRLELAFSHIIVPFSQ